MQFMIRKIVSIAWLGTLLLAVTGFSAEPAPKSKQSAPPVKIEYEKLLLADLLRRAEARDMHAQFELGSRFNYGRSAPKNVKEALHWLRRAAQNGQPEAQRLLAVKFFNGYDVPVDHDEAFKWTQRLAESGDLPGQMTLAAMYANGEGVARNLIRAYMWYAIAASAGQQFMEEESDPSPLMANAAEMREKTAALLMPEEEVEAQQLASEWWLKKQKAAPAKKPAEKTQSEGKH
jgi:TPR repeat protein